MDAQVMDGTMRTRTQTSSLGYTKTRMRLEIVGLISVLIVCVASVSCARQKLVAQDREERPQTVARAARSASAESFEAELAERLRVISSRAGGTAGVAVIHV